MTFLAVAMACIATGNLDGVGGGSGPGSGTGPGTVPEPSSIMLFGSGILGLAGVLRRKLY